MVKDLLEDQIDLEDIIGELLSQQEDFWVLEFLVNSYEFDSPDIAKLVEFLMYFFYVRPKIKQELQSSLNSAILNMILFAKGNFQWEIKNQHDLQKVLDFWNDVGMDKGDLCPKRLFDLIIAKYWLRIIQGEWKLLSRVQQVFPDELNNEFHDIQYKRIQQVFFINEFPNGVPNLDGYYAGLEDLLYLDGLFKDKLMKQIARSKQTSCVICKSQNNLEVHHLIPISCGGSNHLHNLVVVCNPHHSKIHFKGSTITEWPTLTCVD
ncbi:MAG: HNH endonuclease signature motif containing protein [Candidatus Kariarchaeaceae archaeon]